MATDSLGVELDPAQQRVLGCLMEKQRTVPGSYPMTLNALRTACNQTSSRDPVVSYDDQFVETTMRDLRHADLVRFVWSGSGSRAVKYHQLLEERLGLADDEVALLTVLLLRGAQAPGELKTRTERLHAFADRTEVETCLRRMAAAEPPLVAELDRRPGQQDHRWIHLLGPITGEEPVAMPAGPVVDREAVLANGAAVRDARVVAAYDAIAPAYARELRDELAHKPFDAWLLTRVAELAGPGPTVVVGCGPGHDVAFLAAAGADASGVDVSPGMIAQARQHFGELEFEVGDQSRLLRPRHAAGWSAVVAWYSLVHLAASELEPTIAALARTLVPGGWLVVATHVGDDVRHVEELFEVGVDLDFVDHDANDLRRAIEAAGCSVIEWYVRGPYDDHEVATDRLYVLARRD